MGAGRRPDADPVQAGREVPDIIEGREVNMNHNFVMKFKSDNRQLQSRVILIFGEDQLPQPLYPCSVKLESL